MRVFAVLLAAMLSVAAPAGSETIVADLSQRQVAISARFEGSEIILFGAVKRETPINILNPLSVVVTVAGPSQQVTVRRKERVAGIWVNRDAVEIDAAPSFYAVASTRPLDQALSATEDVRWGVTIPRAIRSVGAPSNIHDSPAFTEALIRIKLRDDSYQLNPNSIAFFDQTLFKTSIQMPANLIEGDYKVSLYLTRDRKVIDVANTNLFVRKVGLERWIFRFAHDRPLFYGLFSIFIAISAGWLASAIFQRFR